APRVARPPRPRLFRGESVSFPWSIANRLSRDEQAMNAVAIYSSEFSKYYLATRKPRLRDLVHNYPDRGFHWDGGSNAPDSSCNASPACSGVARSESRRCHDGL